MGEPNIWQVMIALAMLGVNLGAAIIGGTWVLGRASARLAAKIEKAKSEIEMQFMTDAQNSERNFGETVSAIRQKISDMELWNRDNFVGRRTFDLVVTEIKESLKRFDEKLDRWMDKADEKMRDRRRDDG